MKKYKCHKVVKAIEMTRAEYNIYRGWELPKNECGDDEGYLVEYIDSPNKNHNNQNDIDIISFNRLKYGH